MRILAVPACLLVMAAPSLHSQAAPTTKPATLQWGPAPDVFPKGATMAVVSGDPGKAAPFTVELSVPAANKTQTHSPPTNETITGKKGTLLVGMGDTFDASKPKPMKVGDPGAVPANAHHFAAAQGATVIAVS